MSVQQFVIQPPATLALLLLSALVITGAVIIIAAFVTGRNAKTIRKTFFALLVLGLAIAGLGVFLYFTLDTPVTITLGDGYVGIADSSLGGMGNQNFTSSQITQAYVTQLGTGNISLSYRQHGTSYGNFKLGVFTLGNGHTAYVATNNQTVVAAELTNGNYLVLGTSNTQAFADSFSTLVYPLANP